MRKLVITLLALVGIAIASPAAAQPWGQHHHGWRHHHGWHHHHHGPRFGIHIGAPAFPVYSAGHCIRERIVRIRPNGTRVVRFVRRCF